VKQGRHARGLPAAAQYVRRSLFVAVLVITVSRLSGSVVLPPSQVIAPFVIGPRRRYADHTFGGADRRIAAEMMG
jgi:hypothetical protein